LSQLSQQDIAKRYLLGILSEDERNRFEQRYFSDNAIFEEVEIAEDDLVDRYVRGELTDDDRHLFEQALSNSPRLNDRIEFARLLSHKTASPVTARQPKVEPVSKPWFWQRLFAPEQQSVRLAFGFAILVFIIGGTVIVTSWRNLRQQSAGLAARDAELKRRNEEANRRISELQARNEQRASDLQKQAEDLEAQRQSIQEQLGSSDHLENLVASLTLQPGATRSADTRSEFTLNEKFATLSLKLPLIDSDYSRYRAVVLTPDRKPVSKPRTLTPKNTPSGKFLTLSLPLKNISPGDYFVQLEGIVDSGKTEPVNEYPFRINRAK
jgi:anti-sigma factor RsiW